MKTLNSETQKSFLAGEHTDVLEGGHILTPQGDGMKSLHLGSF